MKTREKAGLTVLAIGGIIYHFATMGLTPATVKMWGIWALPANILMDSILVTVLLFLIPGPAEDATGSDDFLVRFFKFDGTRFDHGWWLELRRRSAFLMILASAFLLGAAATAFVVRLLRIRGARAYAYALTAVNIAITCKVFFWLGAFDFLTLMLEQMAHYARSI